MGIYIKGMDFLPEDGTEFIVKKGEYGTWIKPIGHMGFSMRLIEIPEHGRLIDLDKLLRDATRYVSYPPHYEQMLARSEVEHAPTVIEAEWSEDE